MTRFIYYVSGRSLFILPLATFFIIFLLQGYLVLIDKQPLPEYQIMLGYFWLICSPYLVYKGVRTMEWFLDYIKPVMANEDYEKFSTEIRAEMFSWKHLYFSFVLCALFYFFSFQYTESNNLTSLSSRLIEIVFSASGFMAGVGFWGIFVMGNLVESFCHYQLKLDPFCADGHGGILLVGRFLVVMSMLYFSGSLFIPFAISVIDIMSAHNSYVFAYLLLFTYVGFGLVIYIKSIIIIQDKMIVTKCAIDNESQRQLDNLREQSLLSNSTDIGIILKPYIYYKTHHERIMAMRVFPYNTKSIIEILITVMIPIFIFFMDKVIK